LWALFVLANAAVIVVLPAGATIPFHNIWVSLTLLYGFRLWRLGATLPLLAAVCIGSGAAMASAVVTHDMAVDELAEVPMMASMFIAVVWHAGRHQRALEALQRSAAREREFVRHASHQLRTPITVARGHVELVRAASDDRQAVEDVDVVIGELDRLSRISDRLLILAASEHVDFIAHGEVDVRSVLERTYHRWQPAVPRAWSIAVAADGVVVGDADRLEAALDALVENAVKATKDGGAIDLRVWVDATCAVFEVRDDGVGIPEADLSRVFDRFWTVASGPRADRGGTGLGLATVRAIAAAHGGGAEALARPGGGTTVRMRIAGFRPAGAGAGAGASAPVALAG
jgi:two-component system, OmpR family, sensor kinase